MRLELQQLCNSIQVRTDDYFYLKDIQSINKVDVGTLIKAVCTVLEITEDELRSKKRNRNIVDVRMIISYVLRIKYKLTFESIGKRMNKKHDSVIHYLKRHYENNSYCPIYQNKFKKVEKLNLWQK